ncbi:circadian clock protein KaiB [bacterium]|nr:circadian clock protein KaiB [bacterium]
MIKLKLTLYISGQTQKSAHTVKQLKKICDEDSQRTYDIEIIDVLKNPQIAEEKKILATPTLVRELPLPLCRIIGDLSNKEKVLWGLNLTPIETERE